MHLYLEVPERRIPGPWYCRRALQLRHFAALASKLEPFTLECSPTARFRRLKIVARPPMQASESERSDHRGEPGGMQRTAFNDDWWTVQSRRGFRRGDYILSLSLECHLPEGAFFNSSDGLIDAGFLVDRISGHPTDKRSVGHAVHPGGDWWLAVLLTLRKTKSIAEEIDRRACRPILSLTPDVAGGEGFVRFHKGNVLEYASNQSFKGSPDHALTSPQILCSDPGVLVAVRSVSILSLKAVFFVRLARHSSVWTLELQASSPSIASPTSNDLTPDLGLCSLGMLQDHEGRSQADEWVPTIPEFEHSTADLVEVKNSLGVLIDSVPTRSLRFEPERRSEKARTQTRGYLLMLCITACCSFAYGGTVNYGKNADAVARLWTLMGAGERKWEKSYRKKQRPERENEGVRNPRWNRQFDQHHANKNAARKDEAGRIAPGDNRRLMRNTKNVNNALAGTVTGVRRVKRALLEAHGLELLGRDDTHEYFARALPEEEVFGRDFDLNDLFD
ncbi:hypothetical protein BKA70DRAFT_1414177 [Coprinopsis sp. MPI-PUGE-AT-0042]|nr:hypothetical protein BKA70DRAFT_1414177 [Coprinopsis sp. MPI-PUGE-AT-0042]